MGQDGGQGMAGGGGGYREAWGHKGQEHGHSALPAADSCVSVSVSKPVPRAPGMEVPHGGGRGVT